MELVLDVVLDVVLRLVLVSVVTVELTEVVDVSVLEVEVASGPKMYTGHSEERVKFGE